MNDTEFEQELNNLISKSIYKKLKIYNCKCTRCSSLFIANLDDIQCNICKNKNLNKIDIAYLDNEEYLDFAESIYTNEFIYKIHNKKEENECTNIKDFIWKDIYSVKNILNSQKSMLFLYTIVKENKNYYIYKGNFNDRYNAIKDRHKFYGYIIAKYELNIDTDNVNLIYI